MSLVVGHYLQVQLVVVFIDRLVQRIRQFHLVHVDLHLAEVLRLALFHAFFVDVRPRLFVVRFLLADHGLVFVPSHANKHAI